MSILILSDSHGATAEVKAAVERHQAAYVFHCGDFCTDHKKAPFASMRLVRGNCDVDSEVPLELGSVWKNLRIYQTHGHLFGVKSSLLKLHYRAEETGANLVIFGHSHVPVCTVERDILFLNPGSILQPRHFPVPTYALVEEGEAGADFVVVNVTYFDSKGTPVNERGGTFRLRRQAP